MFIHDAQDKIMVGVFKSTLDDFLLLEPSYKLPDGALWQIYVPGSKHIIGYGLYQRDLGTSWSDGDVYLSNETEYSTMQPDTTPNVQGFERDLLGAFGGDWLAINSLYSGWPLFRDTLESEQWSAADLLLTNAYVNYQIDTEIYTAIVAAARANYIPMALQGRPGLMPINITDVITLVAVVTPNSPQTDSASIVATDSAYPVLQNWQTPNDASGVGASESVFNVMPLEPVTPTDSAAVQCSETGALVLPITIKSGDSAPISLSESTPVVV